MGVTVEVLREISRDDGTRVASEMEVTTAVGDGMAVAASTDRTVDARSGGGAATPAGSQPITIKEVTIAKAKAGSDPR